MSGKFDNIIAQLLVQSCRENYGAFIGGQMEAILNSLGESLQNQIAQNASDAVKISPLHRGGSVLQTSQRGGRGI